VLLSQVRILGKVAALSTKRRKTSTRSR